MQSDPKIGKRGFPIDWGQHCPLHHAGPPSKVDLFRHLSDRSRCRLDSDEPGSMKFLQKYEEWELDSEKRCIQGTALS